ncbi:MAG: carboxypeptidase-like regulatory domain-containing protein [Burkholderiales bacterium]|nr:carboxypeptidase-like regulatory domain-containing protein [Burkholderiales bacterium]
MHQPFNQRPPSERRTASRRRLGLRGLAAGVMLAALIGVGCGEVNAMGEVVIFSAVRGVVTSQGKPVAGAKLQREAKWAWGKETLTDATTTAPDGSFSFPALTRRMLLGSFLPHEPSVQQKITVEANGKSHLAWSLLKQNYETNGELMYFDDQRGLVPLRDRSQPMRITCKLENTEHRSGKVFGICDFD